MTEGNNSRRPPARRFCARFQQLGWQRDPEGERLHVLACVEQACEVESGRRHIEPETTA